MQPSCFTPFETFASFDNQCRRFSSLLLPWDKLWLNHPKEGGNGGHEWGSRRGRTGRMRFPNDESWVMKKPDECAWACCKNRLEWVRFCWPSPENGHIYQPQMLMYHPEPLWPAGQLFAEQQCDAALHGLWIPSGSSWRARCCWMENKQTINVKWAFTALYLCGPPYLPVDGFWISRFLSFSNSAKIATRALFGKADREKKYHKTV